MNFCGYHEYIVREQLEEIANYLHHELNINSLKIEVEDGNDFSFYTNIAIEEMNLNDEGKVELKGDKTLEIKWSENVNSQNEFLWIDDFDGLVNKVQELKASNKWEEKGSLEENSLSKGEASYILEIDNSFGISEKIAKKIGVSPTWLKKCSFKITF